MALSMRSLSSVTKRAAPKAEASAPPPPPPTPAKVQGLDTSKTGADFVKQLPGAIPPFDDPYLDPLQFSEGADASRLLRYREAELTHGRVAMLATVGFLVGEQVEGSSFLFDKYISGPAIGHFQQVEEVAPLFWEIIALVVAIAETTRVQKGWNDPYNGKGLWLLKDDYTPGDLAFDPLGLTPDDSEEFEQMRLRELSHCRLAMIAISGMVAQELVDGKTLVGHFSSAPEIAGAVTVAP
jgi:hypothetical protein